MRAGNSTTRVQQQTGASFGAVMTRSIIGTMASVLILKIPLSCSDDWLNTSSKHFLNWKDYISPMPGEEPSIPAHASAHFGEPRIVEKLLMRWDTQEWVWELLDLAPASCSIFLIIKKLSGPNLNLFAPSHFHFRLSLCVRWELISRVGQWIRQIGTRDARISGCVR